MSSLAGKGLTLHTCALQFNETSLELLRRVLYNLGTLFKCE